MAKRSRSRGYRAIQDNGRRIHTAAELRAASLEAMVEDDMIEEIRQAAELGGWLMYHTFDSRKSYSGFYDVVLLRGHRLWLIELKRERPKGRGPSEAQQRWLEAAADIRTVRAAVLRPRDLPALTDAMAQPDPEWSP